MLFKIKVWFCHILDFYQRNSHVCTELKQNLNLTILLFVKWLFLIYIYIYIYVYI